MYDIILMRAAQRWPSPLGGPAVSGRRGVMTRRGPMIQFAKWQPEDNHSHCQDSDLPLGRTGCVLPPAIPAPSLRSYLYILLHSCSKHFRKSNDSNPVSCCAHFCISFLALLPACLGPTPAPPLYYFRSDLSSLQISEFYMAFSGRPCWLPVVRASNLVHTRPSRANGLGPVRQWNRHSVP